VSALIAMLTPEKIDRGWVLPMTPEMADDAGVPEGSLIVLYLKDGVASAEILPPTSEGMRRAVEEGVEKFKDVFAELKRLGD
jgi:hypothetical protein